jgi:protein phosphatase 1 regulatory subunit 7
MMERITNLTDQTQLEEDPIAGLIAAGQEVVLQYSKLIYTPALLRRLDALAKRFGDKLQIRFFGHYGSRFDCAVLRHLPSVRNLAVDCLNAIEHIEAVHELRDLLALSIGVYDGIPANFLDSPAFIRLHTLTLSESRAPNLDLRPLGALKELRRLHITGYSNGIEVLSGLNALQRLSLSRIKNRVNLGFISSMNGLRSLRLILGGRESIEEIGHSGITSLEIIRIRGLCRFVPAVFPGLEYLLIEDQIRLGAIEFTEHHPKLKRLIIVNCKGLKHIAGLNKLNRLSELRISMTSVDIDSLLSQGLPINLKTVGFYTGKQKANREIREKLNALGYSEFGERAC